MGGVVPQARGIVVVVLAYERVAVRVGVSISKARRPPYAWAL